MGVRQDKKNRMVRRMSEKKKARSITVDAVYGAERVEGQSVGCEPSGREEEEKNYSIAHKEVRKNGPQSLSD